MNPGLLLLSLSLIAVAPAGLHAQVPCPPGDLNQYEGGWRPRPGTPARSQHRAPAGSYNAAIADATLDRILGLLRDAYPRPAGGVAYFAKQLHFSSPYLGLPFGYDLYVGHTGFFCTASHRLAESTESGVAINVDVNSFRSTGLLARVDSPSVPTAKGEIRLNDDGHGQYMVSRRRVYRIPVFAGQHRGVEYYTNRRHLSRPGEPPYEQWFVVRKPGAPMFRYVTRREYADQFRQELSTTAAAQEPSTRRISDDYLLAVERYLRDSDEQELSRPVSEPLPFFPRDPDKPEVVFTEGDFAMVYLNLDFMDPGLPRHVPQFVAIRLSARGQPGTAAWELRFRERISDGLDFQALRNLIGR